MPKCHRAAGGTKCHRAPLLPGTIFCQKNGNGQEWRPVAQSAIGQISAGSIFWQNLLPRRNRARYHMVPPGARWHFGTPKWYRAAIHGAFCPPSVGRYCLRSGLHFWSPDLDLSFSLISFTVTFLPLFLSGVLSGAISLFCFSFVCFVVSLTVHR